MQLAQMKGYTLSMPSELKRLRERADLSMEYVAQKCGYRAASGYQRYESDTLYKKPYLPVELVQKLIPVLVGRGEPPISREEVLALAGANNLLSGPSDNIAKDISLYDKKAAPRPGARDLKVLGVAMGGNGDSFEFNGQVADWIERPASLLGAGDAYAIYLTGDSMEPKYEHGQTLFIHPGKPVRPRDYVLVELRDGRAMVKRLVRRSGGKIWLRQFNPDKEFAVDVEDVKSCHKIVTSDELA